MTVLQNWKYKELTTLFMYSQEAHLVNLIICRSTENVKVSVHSLMLLHIVNKKNPLCLFHKRSQKHSVR